MLVWKTSLIWKYFKKVNWCLVESGMIFGYLFWDLAKIFCLEKNKKKDIELVMMTFYNNLFLRFGNQGHRLSFVKSNFPCGSYPL